MNNKEILKKAPMGWNSWDCYGASVTEDIVKKNAEYMAKNLKKYGWEYIVVDIQWYEPTAESLEYHPFADVVLDEYSRLMPATNRFPSANGGKGFKELADYVHSLGLKFGIHIMRGISRQAVHGNCKIKGTDKTARDIARTDSICFWNPDMYGVDASKEGAREYYESLFELYASWGVDFIKCDDIAREMPDAKDELILLSDSLKNCGRDMILSLSPGPALLDYSETYKETAQMWRITDDFWDNWNQLVNMFERAKKWCTHTGGGKWPDADMLPIGPVRQFENKENRTNFTEDEQITMLSLWSIFRSPLMIGGEMTGFDEFTLGLLTNERILEMHENARNSHQVFRKEIDGCEFVLWTASCAVGGNYIALFNLGESDKEVTLSLFEIEIYEERKITSLWDNMELGFSNEITVNVSKHGASVYKIG